MSSPIVPVILSGGAGSRLWPLSTEAMPKQFLRLWNGRSLFEETLARVHGEGIAPPTIICNLSHRDLVRESLEVAGISGASVLLEPMRRDSAAAIAAAAAFVAREHGPGAILAVLPSDHRIAPPEAFRQALRDAAAMAGEGYLVTFGIEPTRPATEYGYVEAGEPLGGPLPGRHVRRFHEKPALAVAEQYLASGHFHWNGGIFVFSASTFMAEAGRHMGDILDSAKAAVAGASREDGAVVLDRESFAGCRQISIDYALFEKADRVAVLPAPFQWSDVGNWSSVHEALAAGPGETHASGDVRLAAMGGSLVISEGIPVRAMGLDNVAIIATKSGVLVVPLDRAAQIKDLM